MSDGSEIESIRCRRRTVCAMLPLELRILLRRWGGSRTVIETIRLEKRRQLAESLRALTRTRST